MSAAEHLDGLVGALAERDRERALERAFALIDALVLVEAEIEIERLRARPRAIEAARGLAGESALLDAIERGDARGALLALGDLAERLERDLGRDRVCGSCRGSGEGWGSGDAACAGCLGSGIDENKENHT